ncbi:MAG: hypothetical protein ACOYL5_05225 [Phototrophicaceae bacterium]|jgi:predicted ArsR family transcriptional regulator
MSDVSGLPKNGNNTAPRLVEFIENKLNSLAKWDLIQYFYNNPTLMGPAPKIASLTGRDLRLVDHELREMAASGLLDVQDQSGVKVYRLSADRDMLTMVEQFLRACDNRQFREAAIYQTIMARR